MHFAGEIEAENIMSMTSQLKTKTRYWWRRTLSEGSETIFNRIEERRTYRAIFGKERSWGPWTCLHKVLANSSLNDEIYVLLGLCTTGEKRDELIRKLNSIRKTRKLGAVIQEQIQCYLAHRPVARESTYHAIAMSNDQGRLLLSDTARKMMQQVTDVTVIARSLICVHCVYILNWTFWSFIICH